MRHYKKKTTLDRKAGPRRALLRSLVESMVLYEKVRTTKAKAKALQSLTERLITTAKPATLSARRAVAAQLFTDKAVKKMVEVLAPRYKDRHGGYTRLVTLPDRKGDGATEAVVEFV